MAAEMRKRFSDTMGLSAYIVWFFLASFAGWLFESAYSIVRTGRWERRGFLFGPICPIYGTGVVAALLLFDRPEVASGAFPAWAVFLVSLVGSAVLEYVVSFALERLFGALWWDYSDMPLNLNGRICLPASLLFAAAGVLVAYVIAPMLNAAAAFVPPQAFELAALLIVALISCDATASALNLSDLMKKIVEIDDSANRYASSQVERAVESVQSLPGRVSSATRKTVDGMRNGAAEVASRVGSARESAVLRVDDAVASQQAKLLQVAERLTDRQVQLLVRLRRFRSEDVRAKADALSRVLRRQSGGEDDEGA